MHLGDCALGGLGSDGRHSDVNRIGRLPTIRELARGGSNLSCGSTEYGLGTPTGDSTEAHDPMNIHIDFDRHRANQRAALGIGRMET